MADNEDTDLVSQIRIEGSEEATKKIQDYADKGAEAFDKVGAAAKKAGDDVAAGTGKAEDAVEDAADKTEKAGQKASDAFKGFSAGAEDAAKKAEVASTKLNAMAAALGTKLGQNIKKNVTDLAQFTQRVAALTVAAGAAGAGILRLAQNVARASSSNTSSIQEQTKAQIDANNAALQAQVGAIGYESAQRKLFQQFRAGGMEYSQYRDALNSLRQEYQEQVRVAAQVEAAQEAVRIENERLQKQAADREAWQALTDTYGGALASSLVTLGRTVQTVANDFRDTLGPAASSVLDIVNSVIQENMTSIRSFMQSASQTITTFVSQNGPQIQQALVSIGTAAGMIFSAVIENGPKFLSLFNDVIVPAVQSAYAQIKAVLDTINSIFGTSLTPGMLGIAAILLRLTGGFQLLFGLVRTGASLFTVLSFALKSTEQGGLGFLQFLRLVPALIGPWGIAIAALVAGLTALYLAVDWQKFGADVQAFANGFVQWFAGLPDQVTGYFTDLWSRVTATVQGWVDSTLELLQSIVDWFVGLPDQVTQIFADLGTALLAAFQQAFDAVTALVQPWVDSIRTALQPIVDLITTIGNFLSGGSGEGASSPPGFARGGHAAGHVRGSGTSTSDSIAAWLSNNEFVVRAKAVAKYGVGFLNALNEGRLSLGEPLKLAAGGLVNVGTPVFNYLGSSDADGSSGDSPMRPFSLHLGNEIFDGLMAPSAVADRLVTYSVKKKGRAAGRKPSWVG